jgi:NIMA-interacting peptidyl-prolyl cis-trans isomerase 1
VRHSQSKNLPYYFNSATSQSSWDPPAGVDSQKLKIYMVSRHTESAAPANHASSGDKIRAAHLLVKHRNSRRPASWKEPNITRSKEEARTILEGFQTQINSGQDLGELATTESDCSSARKRGDLFVYHIHMTDADFDRGWFGRGEMQKEFEDAAFDLKVGEVSPIIESASGLHLIQRLG